MADLCSSSTAISQDFPYQINNTYICGINPYSDAALLTDCCSGPYTNITSPAPTSGPLSDSWPLTCLAYCSILNDPSGPGTEAEDAATSNFMACLQGHGTWDGDVVCTGVNRTGPDGCDPSNQISGCSSTTTATTLGGSPTTSPAPSASQSRAISKSGPKSLFALIVLAGVLFSIA